MNNVQFTPDSKVFTDVNVTFSEKAQLGRPINPNSARQQRLALMEAKIAANGGKKIGRGRPAGTVNVNSARQIALRAAGDANAIAVFEAATGKKYKAEVAK